MAKGHLQCSEGSEATPGPPQELEVWDTEQPVLLVEQISIKDLSVGYGEGLNSGVWGSRRKRGGAIAAWTCKALMVNSNQPDPSREGRVRAGHGDRSRAPGAAVAG